MKSYLLSAATMLAIALASSASGQDLRVAPVQPEIVARLPQSVGNVTFTPENRIIFSHHPFFEPGVRVAELTSQTTSRPFPNESWNTPRAGTDQFLDSVLGLRGDENGIVWMLDMGHRTNAVPKIVGWNTRTDKLKRILYLPQPATRPTSQPNDFVVDTRNGFIYIADEGIGPGGDGSQAALIIVNMETGATRRVLEGHQSTLPENVPIVVDGKNLTVPGKDGKPVVIKVGADGIAADHKFEWLYYGPLNGKGIYRLRIADLINEELTDAALGQKVERYADKPNNGGLSIDIDGNLYLTEVEAKAVGVIPARGRTYQRIASHPDLLWPDGLSYSPDGFMYVSAAQIAEAALFNGGKGLNKAPYLIFRFKPLAPGRPGH